MHALIVGPPQIGKSTLICGVLERLGRPVFGYETKKEDSLAEDDKGSPVYIYPAGGTHRPIPENLLGWCKDRKPETRTEAFDRYAPKLMETPPPEAIIVMDEIGFMESSSERFCDAVLRLLDGHQPILAAVKDKENPYLEKVRTHPNARCFYITEDNRDALAEEVTAFLREQLK